MRNYCSNQPTLPNSPLIVAVSLYYHARIARHSISIILPIRMPGVRVVVTGVRVVVTGVRVVVRGVRVVVLGVRVVVLGVRGMRIIKTN